MTKPRSFAVFDVDGTVFRSCLYRELVQYFMREGLFSEEELARIRQLEHDWRQSRSDESYHTLDLAMLAVFEEKLPDLSVAEYEKAVDAVVNAHANNVFSYTVNLAKQLKSEGYTLIAISGSQTELVQRFMATHNFDICVGLVHHHGDTSFTGVTERVYGRKHTILQEIVEREGLSYEQSIAIGDSAGDISMMELTERSIAFNPDKDLMEHASGKAWDIIVERKGNVYKVSQESLLPGVSL